MISFEEVQADILKRNPGSYYEEFYMKQEKTYIPDVMAAIIKEGSHFHNGLDIGPGWGTLMVWLSEFVDNITVIDVVKLGTWIQPDLLEEKNIKFFQESIFNTSVAGPFDIITMTQVITHLKYNPIDAIQNISRLLTDDGLFVTCVLDREHHIPVVSKFGQYWKALPKYGEVEEPLEDMVTAMYDRYALFELLSYGFENISISRCDSCSELLAVCSKPRRDI